MVKPWDILNPSTPKSTDEIQKERLSVCLDCDKLIQLTKTCSQCGCFMEIKVKLMEAKCPLGKW